MGNPASMTSTPTWSRIWAMFIFSSRVKETPGVCSPSLSVTSQISTCHGFIRFPLGAVSLDNHGSRPLPLPDVAGKVRMIGRDDHRVRPPDVGDRIVSRLSPGHPEPIVRKNDAEEREMLLVGIHERIHPRVEEGEVPAEGNSRRPRGHRDG